MSLEDKRDTAFIKCLDDLLKKSRLSLNELCERTDVTRQHFNLLRRSGSMPSAKLIRLMFNAFEDNGLRLNDLIPFVFHSLGIDPKGVDAAFQSLPYPFDYRPQDVELASRCIYSDKLGECLHKDILRVSLKHMRDGVEFYYFLPHRSQDWRKTISMAEQIQRGGGQLVREKSYCIKCPRFFITSRMRIDNIIGTHSAAYASLGPVSAPSLHPIPRENAESLISTLTLIIGEAKLARQQNESAITYREKGAELKFELEKDVIV